MGVNNLAKTVTRQRRDCDLNPGPSAPESSTLTTRLPSHPKNVKYVKNVVKFKKITFITQCKMTKLSAYCIAVYASCIKILP